jgi:hypothetical protein
LEQIVFVELLEHAALQLNELKFWDTVDLKYSNSRVPPNVISLAPREIVNIDQMITFTKLTLWLACCKKP